MIVSLPDAFLDIIVKYREIKRTGNIHTNINIKIGGNAANFSIALAKLGIENKLIFHSGKLIKNLLEEFVKRNNLKVNLLWVETEDSITVALEKEDRVMFTDPKGIQIDKIEKYKDIIEKAKYIFFGNWNNNKKSNKLLRWVIENSKAKIFLDIGDPSVNYENIDELIEILKREKIWVLSLNEYELEFLCNYLNIKDNILNMAEKLYSILNVERLDLHTPEFVYTLPNKVLVKVNRVEPKILTGAGDTWNAANFYGYINNFDDYSRLKFANEIAKKYVLGEF